MELFRKPGQGNPNDIAEGAVMAEEILKQLQEEKYNGAEKKNNKAAQKTKGTKSGQSQKGKGRITEEKVWKFFDLPLGV